MRIVLVSHFFPPRHNAGTENYTLALARALLGRGHDVRVVCAGDWQTGEAYWNGVTEDIHAGITVSRLHLNWMKAANPNQVLFDSLPVERWFDSFLAEIKPDLVHVTSAHSLGVGVLRSVRRADISLVLTLMDFWFLCPRTVLLRGDGTLCEGPTSAWDCQKCLLMSSHFNQRMQLIVPPLIQRLFWQALAHVPALARLRGARGFALDMASRKANLKEGLKLPDAILTHSGTVQRLFQEAGFSERICHLRHGTDGSWATRYRGKSSSSVIRFGYLGQITPIKGIHVLIEAFHKSGLGANIRLDIWGDLNSDANYVQRLGELIASSRSISLLGRFERSQLADIMAEMDVLVVPSVWYENSPLVIQEAFTAKTPVIATNLGGMAEAVAHEVNGLLFEHGNSDDLAAQIRRIVEVPGLLERLRGGIELVKTMEDETNELETLYLKLVTSRTKTTSIPNRAEPGPDSLELVL